MVNNSWSVLLALATGLLLGGMFFGGLWWTIKKGVSSRRPALWFLGSLSLRTSIVLVGFYLAGRTHWEGLLVCLLGFFMARLLLTRLARAAERPFHLPPEASHAP